MKQEFDKKTLELLLINYTNINNDLRKPCAEKEKFEKLIKEAEGVRRQLDVFESHLSKLDDKTVSEWTKGTNSSKWLPYLTILRKKNDYLLDPLVEQILIEKSSTGRSAWVRLFDETSAALRFPFKKEMLSEAEILNLLSDQNPENRKLAGKSLSEVLENNKRILGMILNVISRDRYIEDNKRGFKGIVSSRNLDNDVEDEVVNTLVTTVNNAMPKLTHRYYKWKVCASFKRRLRNKNYL